MTQFEEYAKEQFMRMEVGDVLRLKEKYAGSINEVFQERLVKAIGLEAQIATIFDGLIKPARSRWEVMSDGAALALVEEAKPHYAINADFVRLNLRENVHCTGSTSDGKTFYIVPSPSDCRDCRESDIHFSPPVTALTGAYNGFIIREFDRGGNGYTNVRDDWVFVKARCWKNSGTLDSLVYISARAIKSHDIIGKSSRPGKNIKWDELPSIVNRDGPTSIW